MMGVNQNNSEKGLSLAMAEVRLACLLVDNRDQPRILKKLQQQREALMVLRRRLENDEGVGAMEIAAATSSFRGSVFAAAISHTPRPMGLLREFLNAVAPVRINAR